MTSNTISLISFPAVIEMNSPLRYRGYTFYQTSFKENENSQATILTVVKNSGQLFPYIASIVIVFGLMLHLILSLSSSIKKSSLKACGLFIFLSLFFLGGNDASAKSLSHDEAYKTLSYKGFSELPVQDQGRIKPMDSLARIYLKAISGRESLEGMEATEWLAEVFFDPHAAYARRVIYIVNPGVVTAFRLESHKDHLYSYNEVIAGFTTPILRVPPAPTPLSLMANCAASTTTGCCPIPK